MHKFLYFLLFTFNFGLAQAEIPSSIDADGLVSEANEFYKTGAYDKAYSNYEQVIMNGYLSVDLHLNAGNAAYKAGLVPESIWNYERAAKLDPSNDDVQFNLELARKKLTDKPKEKSSYGMKYWLASSIGGSVNYWSWISIFMSLGISLTIVLLSFLKSKRIKNLLRIFSLVLGLMLLGTISLAWTKQSVANSVTHVVLFEPSCEVKNEPSEMGSVAFVLHEGSKLKIVDQNELWYKVSFSKNQVGWILKEFAREI